MRWLRLGAWAIALACLMPMLAVGLAALTGGTETVGHLIDSVLGRYVWTTAQIVLIVGIGTLVIGTGTAWLVTVFAFPGRRLLEVLLVLPLAFPAYVLAYAYTHLLDHPGIVQSTLRDVTGWGPRDYWFPEIRSLGGAAAMLALVLYPYVYLLARAAFIQQGGTGFLVARTLGHSPIQILLKVAAPQARPAIASGVLLAVMETIADYGTVAFFGVQTFATGIYSSWFAMADRGAAAQLALCLLVLALGFAILERASRGGRRFDSGSRRQADLSRIALKGGKAWAATLACALPVVLGFVIPVIALASMAPTSEQNLFSPRYLRFVQNSITLASVAALVTVTGALILSYYGRLGAGNRAQLPMNIGRLGYAVPGGVIAVGLMVPFAALDNSVDAWMRAQFGISTGLFFTGSIGLLVMAYMVRFLAAAIGAYESGQASIHHNIDAAARSLGATAYGTLRRVHLPILAPSALTALLIVFVDVMKELPATLIMRPFNFDTLAVQAHRLAADERLEGAAVPSLVIVAVGLLPVLLLCRTMAKRKGD
ncbi:MAG: iron ABC transporter permease [Mangrovicoccus sp.]|nr:iron ABC transporter permease [Mangrovicoccus sp.]